MNFLLALALSLSSLYHLAENIDSHFRFRSYAPPPTSCSGVWECDVCHGGLLPRKVSEPFCDVKWKHYLAVQM